MQISFHECIYIYLVTHRFLIYGLSEFFSKKGIIENCVFQFLKESIFIHSHMKLIYY